jgi:hypothetical protein
MDEINQYVEPSALDLKTIPPDASIEQLCRLLIECEKAQHRYQWASGFLLMSLMNNPTAPKKPTEFVRWLAQQTGMDLSQSEVKRRVAVYRFYAPFADAEIIELIQNGGLRIAYHARRAIDPAKPDNARAVLQACNAKPEDLDGTLNQLGIVRPNAHREKDRIKIRRIMLFDAREELSRSAKHFGGIDWVSLTKVLDLLDRLEKAAALPTAGESGSQLP